MVKKPTPEQLQELWDVCQRFVVGQGISCGEAIYQTDRVSEHAPVFIERVCEVVGYATDEEPVTYIPPMWLYDRVVVKRPDEDQEYALIRLRLGSSRELSSVQVVPLKENGHNPEGPGKRLSLAVVEEEFEPTTRRVALGFTSLLLSRICISCGASWDPILQGMAPCPKCHSRNVTGVQHV